MTRFDGAGIRGLLLFSLPLIAIGLFRGAAYAQPTVRCTVEEGPEGWEGPCEGWDETALRLRLNDGPEADGPWKGTLTVQGSREVEVEIVRQPYGEEDRLVFRSSFGWFLVEQWRSREGRAALLVFDMSQVAPPTTADVRILEDALSRLEQEAAWDRKDDRDCENDAEGVVSLYCALALAARKKMGRVYHRQPALRIVREEIERRFPERIAGHRLMDFNNHPETTLTDVRDVLAHGIRRARRQAESRGKDQPR